MVVHAYDLALGRLRQEDCGFDASQGYIGISRPISDSKTLSQKPKTHKFKNCFYSFIYMLEDNKHSKC
jgi:hypothetical protein